MPGVTCKRSIVAAPLAIAAACASFDAHAITRCQVLEDAQSWVDHQVMYCQGPYGSYCTSGCDPCYYDPLRGGDCWRPDCSGYVSATWWLSYAMNTWGLCDYAYHIGWDDLQPGDAVVACSQHAILFASWADATHSTFHAYETGTCGTPAHHSTRNRWSMGEYTPLRRPDIQGCCNAGEVETQACGNCGQRTRSCNGNGEWGGWSGCEGQGPCSPGQQDSQGCCDCGNHTRECGGNCQWQEWSACAGPDPNGGNNDCDTGEPGPCASGHQRCVQGCVKCVRDYEPKPETCDGVDNDCNGVVDEGQGPCSPGEHESRSCCDCGSQTRACGGNCQWQEWSACGGPDPNGGNNDCDTGQPGPCASGHQRCQQGCVKCVRDYEPKPEACDGVDNDCSGAVDDGYPTKMGDPPPVFAAELKDQSYPLNLSPGEPGSAWAVFVNRGSATWKRGDIWLTTRTALDGDLSPLYQETWPAWDVAATLDKDVVPGEKAYFRWTLLMPDNAQGNVKDTFVLSVPPDHPLHCPAPDVAISVRAGMAGHEPQISDVGDIPSSGGCSVSAPRQSALSAAWLAIAGLALGVATRRR